MPIKPQPFKFVCSKCGYSRIVRPESDVINPMDMVNICPKCSSKMKKEKLDVVDDILSIFK